MQNAVICCDKRNRFYLDLCQRWQQYHLLCFSYYPACLFGRPSKALSEEAGRWVSPALKVLQSEDLKHERKKYNIHISSSHICGLFKTSLSSNHGRKTCRTVQWPQGIYVCFHDCNLTASESRLKACLCVPELSFVLALIAEGLYREPPHGATVVKDLIILSGHFCSQTTSLCFPCTHNVCSTQWPALAGWSTFLVQLSMLKWD